MTVRFKAQSEYQKSYGAARSSSASPQRYVPLDHRTGIRRQPGLQRLKRPGPLGAARSLLGSPEEAPGARGAPSAASRSCSPHQDPPLMDSEPRKVPGSAPEPESPAEPGSSRPIIDGKSAKLRPSEPESSRTAAAPEPRPDSRVDRALRWKAGMRPRGQRSGGHRSEYHRQFGWKKPASAASPLLTAERVLHSSSRSVPPFKKNPVTMETEYGRSFQGLKPASGPRLRRHLERERDPVFDTHRIHRRKSLELPPNPEAAQGDSGARSPAAQVQRRRRMLTEYQSSFRSPLCRNPEGGRDTDDIAVQVKELRQQALTYRLRAWGTNFSRNHLSQLLSEYNALWEPTDTTDSHTEPSTPRLSPEPDGRSASCVEALDLASNSSKGSSAGAGKTQRSPGTETPPDERRTAWGEQEDTDEKEGRLPTPRVKTRPVHRTHHDLTTPATGGAILVGKLTNADASSPNKQKEKLGTAVLRESGSEADISKPAKLKEAWSENIPVSLSPSPNHKRMPSPNPTRTKQASPCPLTSPPQHGIQGMLRHPDFQHNGELGLRLRERPCSRGGCGSDEDDRLSVMSWRSAASCSAASAVLERAQKRRESFWGKR
ncbi:nuclear protein MDM1 [Fundulus heteroclitus]|uniref:nuclear protein MDM1 n=1 Tax=Fundulus heteroclitus TaxID=8078 RepID=UPI00165C0CF0|nr:nuclear protein MDM1 [Fundulus heteroclitus]